MAREYEDILDGVLSRIPEGYDTREGSVLWEAVAPLCAEIAQMELVAEAMQAEAYVGTASGEYLDRLGNDYGFKRELATSALVKARLVGGEPEIGNRFSSMGLENEIIYKIVQKGLEPNIWYLQNIEYNAKANYYIGEIAMIDYINDLQSAEILEISIPQKPTETDDEFRARIQGNLAAESSDGNKKQYEQWLDEIDGVGKSKVTPLWNGANTVKCTILNEVNTPALTELIEKVQNILDPGKTGLGEGLAPIGAVVTIDTAQEFSIEVETTITYAPEQSTAPELKNEIEKYLGNLALTNTSVSYLTLASVITYDKNVDTVTSLKLNGGVDNLQIPVGSVPVLKKLTVNGVSL